MQKNVYYIILNKHAKYVMNDNIEPSLEKLIVLKTYEARTRDFNPVQ